MANLYIDYVNFLGTPTLVSKPGVYYMDGKDALVGSPVGTPTPISARIWIDEEKFINNVANYQYLLLKVDLPEGSDDTDDIVVNDFKAQPVEISPKYSSRQ